MTASWCSQSELVLLSDLCQLRLPLGLQYQLGSLLDSSSLSLYQFVVKRP